MLSPVVAEHGISWSFVHGPFHFIFFFVYDFGTKFLTLSLTHSDRDSPGVLCGFVCTPPKRVMMGRQRCWSKSMKKSGPYPRGGASVLWNIYCTVLPIVPIWILRQFTWNWYGTNQKSILLRFEVPWRDGSSGIPIVKRWVLDWMRTISRCIVFAPTFVAVRIPVVDVVIC